MITHFKQIHQVVLRLPFWGFSQQILGVDQSCSDAKLYKAKLTKINKACWFAYYEVDLFKIWEEIAIGKTYKSKACNTQAIMMAVVSCHGPGMITDATYNKTTDIMARHVSLCVAEPGKCISVCKKSTALQCCFAWGLLRRPVCRGSHNDGLTKHCLVLSFLITYLLHCIIYDIIYCAILATSALNCLCLYQFIMAKIVSFSKTHPYFTRVINIRPMQSFGMTVNKSIGWWWYMNTTNIIGPFIDILSIFSVFGTRHDGP